MEQLPRRWIAGLAVLAAAACATAGSRDDPPDERPGWFARRGRDLLAVFDADLSFGPGIGVRAALTQDAQLGFMALGPWEQGPTVPTWTCVAGIRGGELGAWQIRDLEYGVSPWYPSDAATARIGREEDAWHGDLAETRGTQLSVQIHAALIGFEFGFDPCALGRFFAGFFGYEGGPPPP